MVTKRKAQRVARMVERDSCMNAREMRLVGLYLSLCGGDALLEKGEAAERKGGR